MTQIIPFSDLSDADLIVDAVYEGGTARNTSADPLSKLLHCGNQGGFRKVGTRPDYVVLYSTLDDLDWPDWLDTDTGIFTYFGDNKRPGHELHDTRPGGNRLLSKVFGAANHQPPVVVNIPPFFVFTKARISTQSSRSVQFRGLAVPGGTGISAAEELVAVWKSTQGHRFQNYRAIFTILDAGRLRREWLDELRSGVHCGIFAPLAWRSWVETQRYIPLTALSTISYRTVQEQLPTTPSEWLILATLYDRFKDNPYRFEACAAALAQMIDGKILIDEITRPVADGGRDAIGRYRIGPETDPIHLSLALEAKCFSPGSASGKGRVTVGVRDTARLISRLRHREFGVLVTTSAVAKQAYQELRHDRHPVIVISGLDIVQTLIRNGIATPGELDSWLNSEGIV